jgi:hypothetical protein
MQRTLLVSVIWLMWCVGLWAAAFVINGSSSNGKTSGKGSSKGSSSKGSSSSGVGLDRRLLE